MNFRPLVTSVAKTPIFPKENKGFREGDLFTKNSKIVQFFANTSVVRIWARAWSPSSLPTNSEDFIKWEPIGLVSFQMYEKIGYWSEIIFGVLGSFWKR